MKSIARNLTYANVVSTLALFIALGLGGAYAASKITSKDLAKGSVKSKAIKNKTIVGKDVKDGKLTGADIAPGSVLRPTLGTGGQNDCLWLDSAGSSPGLAPVEVHRNAVGEVSFDGVVLPTDGPGGDATCSGAGPESSEDSTVFTLPPADTPATTHLYTNPTGASAILVVGANGASLGSTPMAPGTVATAISGPAFLNEISYLAADAEPVTASQPGKARIKLSQLRAPAR
jgi:hypothetical protein